MKSGVFALLVLTLIVPVGSLTGQDEPAVSGADEKSPPVDAAHAKVARKLIDGGIKYLLSQRDAGG